MTPSKSTASTGCTALLLCAAFGVGCNDTPPPVDIAHGHATLDDDQTVDTPLPSNTAADGSKPTDDVEQPATPVQAEPTTLPEPVKIEPSTSTPDPSEPMPTSTTPSGPAAMCGAPGQDGTFESMPRQWGEPQVIGDDTFNAYTAQMAFDGAGNFFVVWRRYEDPVELVWTSRYASAEGTWSEAELLSARGANGYSPHVAVDGKGNARAIWAQQDGAHFVITTALYDAGQGVWGSAQALPSEAEGDADRPRIVMDDAGNAIAVWDQQGGATEGIWSSQYDVSSDTWSNAAPLEGADTVTSLDPRVVMHADGTAIAVWRELEDTFYRVRASRLVGGTWLAAEDVGGASPGGVYNAPEIALDPLGNSTIIWQAEEAGDSTIWANRYDAAADAWADAERVDANEALGAQEAQLAMDCAGNAFVVWDEVTGPGYGLAYNRYDAATGGWGVAELISDPGSGGGGYAPWVGVDAGGNAVAVWYQEGTGQSGIWASHYDAVDDAWSPAGRINNSDQMQYGSFPRIVVEPSGESVAVWAQQAGSTSTLSAVHYQ